MKKIILLLILLNIVLNSISFSLKELVSIKYNFNFEIIKENNFFILSKNIDIINNFILLFFIISFGLFLKKKEKEIL